MTDTNGFLSQAGYASINAAAWNYYERAVRAEYDLAKASMLADEHAVRAEYDLAKANVWVDYERALSACMTAMAVKRTST